MLPILTTVYDKICVHGSVCEEVCVHTSVCMGRSACMDS